MISDKFAKVFYHDTVTVLKVTKGTGYNREEKTEVLTEITGDMQSFSGGLANEEYGLNIECKKRFFCKEHEALKPGNYIDAGGVRYRIEYADNGRLGAFVLLSEVVT